MLIEIYIPAFLVSFETAKKMTEPGVMKDYGLSDDYHVLTMEEDDFPAIRRAVEKKIKAKCLNDTRYWVVPRGFMYRTGAAETLVYTKTQYHRYVAGNEVSDNLILVWIKNLDIEWETVK